MSAGGVSPFGDAPEDPVIIADYDPAWPARFAAERTLLAAALAPWLAGPIEHIGSTAVPGLAAKPVIDIMAAVESLAASRGAIAAVRSLQYQYAPYRPDVMHWFCKPGPSLRTHHLHLVPAGSGLWQERLAFRDALGAPMARSPRNIRRSSVVCRKGTAPTARPIRTPRRLSSRGCWRYASAGTKNNHEERTAWHV